MPLPKSLQMRGSHKIARLSGVDIKVHWTFWILLGWFFFSYYRDASQVESGLYAIGLVLAVILSVLAHELGHGLMAKRFGFRNDWLP